jgi:hypothetical protein
LNDDRLDGTLKIDVDGPVRRVEAWPNWVGNVAISNEFDGPFVMETEDFFFDGQGLAGLTKDQVTLCKRTVRAKKF